MSSSKLRSNLVLYFSIFFFLQIGVTSTSENWSESECYERGGFVVDDVCTIIEKGGKCIDYNKTEILCANLMPGGRPVMLKGDSMYEIEKRLKYGCKYESCVYWVGLHLTMPGYKWKWIDGSDYDGDWSNPIFNLSDGTCFLVHTTKTDYFFGRQAPCCGKSVTHTICQASIESDPSTLFRDLAFAAIAIFCLLSAYTFRREICGERRRRITVKQKSPNSNSIYQGDYEGCLIIP